MRPIDVAKSVLPLLEDGKWHETQQLKRSLGHKTGTVLRKVLRMLESKGVTTHRGTGKIRWQLTNPNYDRTNPFKTQPSTNGSNMATSTATQTTPLETEAKFKGMCPKCGQSYADGTRIVQWLGHDNPKTGKPHWIHKQCPTITDTDVDAAKQAVQQQLSGVSNDQLNALTATVNSLIAINDKLLKRIGTLEEKQPPREIVLLKEDGKTKVKSIKGPVHKIFEQVLFHIQCGDNVMLVGPRGSGKSTLAEDLASTLDMRFGTQNLSGGITEGKLFGRVTPDINTGKQIYHRPEFIDFAEDGGLYLLDEVDNGDPNLLVGLNGLLSTGKIALDRPKNPMMIRHKDFVCLSAANTWGNGADRQYVGRNQLDAAFIERFEQIEMDYDRDLERALVPVDELLNICWKWRDAIFANKVQRTCSTRFICRAHKWMQKGKGLDYVTDRFFAGWRKDEIVKVK